MDRMKTFFFYFLLLSAMFIGFNLLENGLTSSMFAEIKGEVQNVDGLTAEVIDSKASNVNGYMDIKITNDSNETINGKYAKVDLLDEYGNVASTEYIEIKDLAPGESRVYKIKHDGESISSYKLGFVDEKPDKSNIIDIFGWEIDKTDAFGSGIDLTNINGVDVSGYIGKTQKFLRNKWLWGLSVVRAVPLWAYIIAGVIVIWYM